MLYARSRCLALLITGAMSHPSSTYAQQLAGSPAVSISEAAQTMRQSPQLPGPRVPLQIESNGQQQTVSMEGPLTVVTDSSTMDIGRGKSPVCVTPCTMRVFPGPNQIYTAGPGLAEADLSLDVPMDGVRVRVRAVPRQPRRLGLSLVIGGSVVTGLALVALGTGAMFSDTSDSYGQGHSDAARGAFIASGVFGGIGMGLLAGGISLFVQNRLGIESSGPAR